MAILGVNSLDNRLYFVTQEEEEETDMSVLVEEEAIATLPVEIIQVSDALAKEHLDCKLERLVRNLEENRSTLPLPASALESLDSAKTVSTPSTARKLKHFFRARALSSRQLFWDRKSTRNIDNNDVIKTRQLSRSQSVNGSLDITTLSNSKLFSKTSNSNLSFSAKLTRRRANIKSCSSTESQDSRVQADDSMLSNDTLLDDSLNKDNVASLVKTRSLPNQYSVKPPTFLRAGTFTSPMYVNSPHHSGSGRYPSGLPPIPPSRTHSSQQRSDFSSQNEVNTGNGSTASHENTAADRCSSPSPSRGGTCPRKTTRSYILHRQCNLGTLHSPLTDVAILYSSRCPVSTEWASYIQMLFKASVSITKHCQNNLQMTSQCVELFSELLSNETLACRKRLNFLEEVVAHARVQIVILSRPFLQWIYAHPSLVVGNLLADPSKVIGLFLGINRSEILPEHRSPLLTFSDWFATMDVTSEETSRSQSNEISSFLSESRSGLSDIHSGLSDIRSCSSDNGSVWTEQDPFPEESKESKGVKADEMNVKPSEVSEGQVDETESKETFSLQLHRSALQILQNTNATQGKWIGSSKRILEKSYQVWPLVVNLVKPSSKILILLSQQVKTPESVCEVSLLSTDDLGRKTSAICKQISPTTLEVVVPQLILGNSFAKRCQVSLSVNGEPWTSKSNHVDIKISSYVLTGLDSILADMVAKCLPSTIFKSSLSEREAEKDPELPTIIHWSAKNGLPKTTQALMSFPNSLETAGRLNNQMLNASELAHRHGHLEVAHLLRPFGNHNYDYPNLTNRPVSDSAISVNEKVQGFLNSNIFASQDCNGNDLAKSDFSPRRVSDPGTAQAQMSNSSVNSIFFQGPNLKNIQGSMQGPSNFEGSKTIPTSESNEPPLYDVPRILEDNCYDVPPKPVPVLPFPDGSFPDRPKTNSYISMKPRCNSQPVSLPSSNNITASSESNHYISSDVTGSTKSRTIEEDILLRPQSRGEILSEFYSRNSPTDLILTTDKDIIDPRTSPPISAFEPVIIPDYERVSDKLLDKPSTRTVSTSLVSLSSDGDKVHLPLPAKTKSKSKPPSKVSSYNTSKESVREVAESERSTPTSFGNLLKKSLISVSGTLKRKKKTSISSSKLSLATPEKNLKSQNSSSKDDEEASLSNGCRKRSLSSIPSFSSSLSALVQPDQTLDQLVDSTSQESSPEAFTFNEDSSANLVDPMSNFGTRSKPVLSSSNVQQHLYDVPRQLSVVGDVPEMPQKVVCILSQTVSEVKDSNPSCDQTKVKSPNAGAYENVIIRALNNGIFDHEDPDVCDKFYTCDNGTAHEMPCAAPLVFDSILGSCTRDEQKSDKAKQCNGAHAGELKTIEGFTCPGNSEIGPNGLLQVHPVFPHPTDCQFFFTCFFGKEPNKFGCTNGQVFDASSLTCKTTEEVPDCACWYDCGEDSKCPGQCNADCTCPSDSGSKSSVAGGRNPAASPAQTADDDLD